MKAAENRLVLIGVVGFVLWAAGIGSVIFVAAHFINKFW